MKNFKWPLIIIAILVLVYLIFFVKSENPNDLVVQPPPVAPPPSSISPPISAPPPSISDVSTWKTYSNAGIEFKYPSHWSISENLYDHPAAVFPAGEIRLTGDGYIFAINPNEGFGEFPPDQYQTIHIEVNNKNIDGVETIDNLIHKYFLGFGLYRPDSTEFYFFRLSGSLNTGKDISEIKQMIMKFVKTIKII